ncbi:MAG: class I SAM-dependent methyltransferase [Nitrososphaerales archaeon]
MYKENKDFNYQGIIYLTELEKKLPDWLREKAELILSLIEGKRVLEVGCGIGSLTNFLFIKGYELFANDISQLCIKEAMKKNLPITFIQGDICDSSIWSNFSESFDTVIMSDVLEHIKERIIALRNVNFILRERGILILKVPAYNFLYSSMDKKVGHLLRYSKDKLLEELKLSKFKLELCRYWNFLGIFGWLYLKYTGKDLKDLKMKNSLSKIYGNLLNWESRLKMPLGLTLVVKARKWMKIIQP